MSTEWEKQYNRQSIMSLVHQGWIREQARSLTGGVENHATFNRNDPPPILSQTSPIATSITPDKDDDNGVSEEKKYAPDLSIFDERQQKIKWDNRVKEAKKRVQEEKQKPGYTPPNYGKNSRFVREAAKRYTKKGFGS